MVRTFAADIAAAAQLEVQSHVQWFIVMLKHHKYHIWLNYTD